jgi:hypothetical protein
MFHCHIWLPTFSIKSLMINFHLIDDFSYIPSKTIMLANIIHIAIISQYAWLCIPSRAGFSHHFLPTSSHPQKDLKKKGNPIVIPLYPRVDLYNTNIQKPPNNQSSNWWLPPIFDGYHPFMVMGMIIWWLFKYIKKHRITMKQLPPSTPPKNLSFSRTHLVLTFSSSS